MAACRKYLLLARVSLFGLFGSLSFLLDTGTLTASFTLEVDLGAAYPASLIQVDGFDIRREQGESPFHTHAIGDLTYGKSGRLPLTLTLDHIALETLDTLLVSFHNLIVHRNIITGFELRKLSFSRQLLMYKSYSSVHNFIF